MFNETSLVLVKCNQLNNANSLMIIDQSLFYFQ